MFNLVKKLRKNFPKAPLLNLLTNEFSGRTTFFAVFFAASATVLAWFGKLTASYAEVITALQAYIVIRALGDDYHERNNPNNTTDSEPESPRG